MGGDAGPHHGGGFPHTHAFKRCVGDLAQHLDAELLPSVKIEAVLGQCLAGAVDGHGQDGELHLVGQAEGPRLEGPQPGAGGTSAFGKHVDGAAPGQSGLAAGKHAGDALLVAALQGDVAIEVHVPADEGQAEHLDFGHPLEGKKETESHEDVELGLVVGDDFKVSCAIDYCRGFCHHSDGYT